MSLELKGLLVGKVPLAFVIGSFICGLIVLNCTPLRFINSQLVIPYFLNSTDAAQISVNLLRVFLVYTGLGALFHFATPLFSSDSGLNKKVKERMSEMFGERRPDNTQKTSPAPDLGKYFTPALEVSFTSWLRKHKYLDLLGFLGIESDIIGSVIVASELSIFFSLTYFAITGLLPILYLITAFSILFPYAFLFLMQRASLDLLASFLTIMPPPESFVWFVIIPLVLFFSLWAFNRYYFRTSLNDTINTLRCSFINYLNENLPTTKNVDKLKCLAVQGDKCVVRTNVEDHECPMKNEGPLKYCKLRNEKTPTEGEQ